MRLGLVGLAILLAGCGSSAASLDAGTCASASPYATSEGKEFRQRMARAGQMVAILTAVYLALGLLPLAAAVATRC
jgi:hypothetical protein